MLLYFLVVVDIIERIQQKQTSYQTAARRRVARPLPPKCHYQWRCARRGRFHFCWPRQICSS